jgi:hypothetical protein
MKIDIEKAFLTEGRSIYDFFQRPGVGFYIPLYQRDYSWDEDNIEQLIEDIEKGVTAMIHDEKEIRFLGTIITVVEKERKRIQPLDIQALPTSVEKIIDGQQRLSTIALLGTQLYKHFQIIENKIKKEAENKDEIIEVCQMWKAKLIEIFSFDLRSGKPKRKPKLIRGYLDEWTKEGEVEKKYISGIAKYLAKFILSIDENSDFPEIPKSEDKFSGNTKLIDNWLKKIIEVHATDDDLIPPAWEILAKEENNDFIWSYHREKLTKLISQKEKHNKKSEEYLLCSLVQLISISHYLLERCCFTIIQPINEDWAFDMFQSLNSSGTPLTAIETFKPLVVNTTEINKQKYEDSQSKISFSKIEELFRKSINAAAKSKLTNEFLTSVAIVIDGWKLESHFSSQRKYLDRIYITALNNIYADQCNFINFFGNYAEFYKKVWIEYKGVNDHPLEQISSSSESELASLLILFLKKSNHRMAITILGCLYSDVVNGKNNSISNFIEGVKAVSAFYILWRACDSNAKLDTYYRSYFKGNDSFSGKNWLATRGDLNIQDLKEYLKDSIFREKNITVKEDWVTKSMSYLKYENSAMICRIALLIAAHDTVVDDFNPGLMKKGKKKCSEYLTIEKWNSEDLKHIEHIAPKQNDGGWDSKLYDENSKLFDSIGNLTLLPSTLNISASNKGWQEKSIYYQHLGTKDAQKAQELSAKAQKDGIILKDSTLKLLTDSSYNEHILPLLSITQNQDYNSLFVEKRAKRILELTYDTIIDWLS